MNKKQLQLAFCFAMVVATAFGQTATEVKYLSGADNSMQSAMFFAPQSDLPKPLMVTLHSWSADYRQKLHEPIEKWCVANGWAYIHPNFRGPNRRPEATGSQLVVDDILSSIEFAKKQTKIDKRSIYLVGTSGGGYASLLMAGRHPDIWAGVSAWVPISDLAAWYHETKKAKLRYANEIVASCGGVPGESPEIDEQYKNRSPLTYLANAKGVRLHINAGITDGHTGSVPVSHSLLAFNKVANETDRFSPSQIREFVSSKSVPESLRKETLRSELLDKSYGEKRPLFRRRSGNATVTIFDGGHELIADAAIAWFEQIHKQRGATAVQ